ncbi:bifunctional rhamnulose-1-phosphate aldolase/short-chain dehydrogenase [Candidatus Sumerlaeota bacterium]|nr:bifunctional rhamnulose-1-phosphate aldolase/short-chain dehydrogenase [Candidatus Sumerlaeota bacterium]
MTQALKQKTPIQNRWNDEECRGISEPESLCYRSRLLGADLRITNFGGGNTSVKVAAKDPLTGEETTVLWVKGSGGDLGSIELGGFSTLYMDKLQALKGLYRGLEHEDEMVDYLPHCTFDLNPRAASIDTPLHAYLPYTHIDHMHPDAIIAIAAAKDGEALTESIFGGEIGWLPWQRPGYDLGLKLGALTSEKPNLRGIVLGGHGLFTWAETSKECYENTLEIIQIAADYLEENGSAEPCGASSCVEASKEAKRELLARLMPVLRGKLSKENRKIGHFNDSPAVMEFVNSSRCAELAAMGTSCPDHFLRTKIRPLFIEFDPSKQSADDVLADIDGMFQRYREGYAAYYERCRREDSPTMRDPYPVVILIPGVGMLTYAKDKATARISGEFYENAVNVMRGASGISEYVALPEQEAFNIEYWRLEEAKLRRMPKPKSLAGRIAVVTGGAGGIGRASARRLLDEGACVVLCDVFADGLAEVAEELRGAYGPDAVRSVVSDVTDEASVIESFRAAAIEYGGVDILVSCAGIASAAPYEETSLELWQKNMDILSTGYFLVSREAYRMMKQQQMGGSIIFIASKNSLVASPNAAAYCSAKAAEVHLARCLALEGAEHGVRVNVVNPDAVLQGSRIWQGQWRKERAEAYDIEPDELEEHYRERSMLKVSVYPEDVAEAVYFFASDRSAKSTGNILNVDAGNAASFTR